MLDPEKVMPQDPTDTSYFTSVTAGHKQLCLQKMTNACRLQSLKPWPLVLSVSSASSV